MSMRCAVTPAGRPAGAAPVTSTGPTPAATESSP